jgi:hypothetical protein
VVEAERREREKAQEVYSELSFKIVENKFPSVLVSWQGPRDVATKQDIETVVSPDLKGYWERDSVSVVTFSDRGGPPTWNWIRLWKLCLIPKWQGMTEVKCFASLSEWDSEAALSVDMENNDYAALQIWL